MNNIALKKCGVSDAPATTDGLATVVTQSKTSHWCEFTKTWPYPEICITCGGEAPVLYDSDTIFDTSSSGDADETRTDDPLQGKASKEEKVIKSKSSKKATKKAVEINDFHKILFKDFPLFLPESFAL